LLEVILCIIIYFRQFAESGALKKLQELLNTNDAEVKHIVSTFLRNSIDVINSQYKDEMLALFRNKDDVLKKLVEPQQQDQF
jgi:hypothetical protein